MVLGALHGPAELLPISSSAHITIVPWLLGWSYGELDPEYRKEFEVALHAGTAAALLLTLRSGVGEALGGLDRRSAAVIALSCAPPALIGFALERPIERHLGSPPTIAAGLLVGAAVMAYADRSPQRRRQPQAGAVDAAWLGLAQAAALIPGVSRGGATRAAARLLRFTREDASRLSSHVALPVIAGATALKSVRLHRRTLTREAQLPLALGTAGAFASTLGCSWLVRRLERERALWPYAAYRAALSAVVVARLIRDRRPR